MKYYGITIGPINATLALAAKPAGLWYASYMFSDITRMLCAYLSAKDGVSILSPYYEKNEPTDGIGSYHDRVLFSVDVDDPEDMDSFVQEVIQRVKTGVGNRLARDLGHGEDKDKTEKITAYMHRYLCIHYLSVSDAEKGDKSVGEALSAYLDTLELYENIPESGGENYLLTMFGVMEEGSDQDTASNKNIKNSELVKRILNTGKKNFQLFEKGRNRIKNLAYISGAGKTKKKHGEEIPDTGGWKKWKYYAVVQADGDNLGEAGRMIGDDLKISEICKRYTKRCAKLIGEKGGMAIFAGGDDLLFLAPVQNRDGETLFTLCSKISEIYMEEFKEVNDKLSGIAQTSLSMGIAVSYWKFPLYEALKKAKDQLFQCAKKTKNTLAIVLNKSGGSKIEGEYLFGSEKEKRYLEFLDNVLEKEVSAQGGISKGEGENEQTDSGILHSMLYHIKEYEALFRKAIECGEKETGICLDNMFERSKSSVYFQECRGMMLHLVKSSHNPGDVYKEILFALRFVHFFAEKEE